MLGSFIVSAACARIYAAGGGRSSQYQPVSGIRGNEGRVAHGAPRKAPVIARLKVMAVELAGFAGIRVNAYRRRGPVETPPVAVVYARGARGSGRGRAHVPPWRHGRDRRADPVPAGRGAPSYVTGQVLSMDGGLSAAGIMSGTSEAGNRNGEGERAVKRG